MISDHRDMVLPSKCRPDPAESRDVRKRTGQRVQGLYPNQAKMFKVESILQSSQIFKFRWAGW